MNIASFLSPKIEVTFLRDDMSLEEGLIRLKKSGYSAVPVIDREDRYVGVVKEGDFLWRLLEEPGETDTLNHNLMENCTIRDIIRFGVVKAVCIDTDMEQLVEQAKNQNFVPVVDDRNVFIGIVTRRDIIGYFINLNKTKGREGSGIKGAKSKSAAM